MVSIIFVQADGTNRTVESEAGQSIMAVAVKNGVGGIDADCGGACACATCHVTFDEEWFKKLAPASEVEREMLEFAVNPQPSSRLSCQIFLETAFDGITVRLPQSQR